MASRALWKFVGTKAELVAQGGDHEVLEESVHVDEKG